MEINATQLKVESEWQGLPYFPISQFYRRFFGQKVYKIPVSTATTCPNREGLRGMKTCNFCDVWGSAAYPEIRHEDLAQQIEKTRARLVDMYRAEAFLVYFQAYTTTFSKVDELRRQFEVAEKMDVRGFVVGTRPDCLSDRLFELFNDYVNKGFFVAAEFGVQSFDEDQLIWMRRGHTAKQSVLGIQRLKQFCPDVNIGIHLIFGVPGESDDQLKASAQLINSLPVDNVKLHHLHVLKDTPLADEFVNGTFSPIERDEYFRRCQIFLEQLSPQVSVHRLSALSTRPEELLAPDWTARKMETYQGMINFLKARSTYQGKMWTQTEPVTIQKWSDPLLYNRYLAQVDSK